MIKIHLVAPDGSGTTLEAKPSGSLMQAAVARDAEGIAADCGGMLTCATCHVYVREPFASRLPPAQAEELAMLAFTASPRKPNSRLSCQVALAESLDGLTVDLPASQY